MARPSSTASEKEAEFVQKLGQLQPFIAVFSPECMGQLEHLWGRPDTFLAARVDELLRSPGYEPAAGWGVTFEGAPVDFAAEGEAPGFNGDRSPLKSGDAAAAIKWTAALKHEDEDQPIVPDGAHLEIMGKRDSQPSGSSVSLGQRRSWCSSWCSLNLCLVGPGFYGMGVYNIGQMALGKQGGGKEKKPWVTHMMEGR